MNKSLFTKSIKNDDYTIFYNTLSGAVVSLDEDNINKLSDHIDELCELGLVDDSGVEKDKLFYEFDKLRKDTSTVNYTILLTYECNLECIYCYEGERKKKQSMNKDTCLKVTNFILNDIKYKNASKVNIMFYGGEPLLNIEGIALIGNKLKKELEQKNIEFSSSMISNGVNLNLDVIEMLKAVNLSQIQITLDGPKEIHDTRRCSKDGCSYFDTILNNIKVASKYFNIILRVNFDKQNVKTIFKLIDDISSLKNDNIIFKFAPTYDLCKNYVCDNTFVLTSKETADSIINLTKYAIDNGFKVDDDILGIRLCGVYCKSDLVIDPIGNLYKCIGYVGLKDYIIGNIDSNNSYIENNLFKEFLESSPWNNAACGKCEFLPVCGSGCRYHASILDKSLNSPHCKKEFYLSLYDKLIKTQYVDD